MEKFLLFCSLLFLCVSVVSSQNTFLVFHEDATASQIAGLQASLATTSAVVTSVLNDPVCSPSVMLNPVDPVAFPKWIYYVNDPNEWNNCSPTDQTAFTDAITNYAAAGGHFLYSGVDGLANPTQPLLISILGGTSSTDAFTGTLDDIETFTSDSNCDILLNGVGGNLLGVAANPGSFPDTDYDTLNGGTASKCLIRNASPDNGYWSVLPSGSGYITWMSDFSFTQTLFNNPPGGQMDIGLWNFIGFASSVIGGDPHIQAFDGSLSDLQITSGQVVNLLSTDSLQLNARVSHAPLRDKVLYLSAVGVQFKHSKMRLMMDIGNFAEQSAARVFLQSPERYIDLTQGGLYDDIIESGGECRLLTATKRSDAELFESLTIPGSRNRQSPIIRANLRCVSLEFIFEIHEFQHLFSAVEGRDDIEWAHYDNILFPVSTEQIGEAQYIYERRIDVYAHEVSSSQGTRVEKMSGVLGMSHGRAGMRKEKRPSVAHSDFVVESNDLFGVDTRRENPFTRA